MATEQHITLQVEGMTCNNCALGVRKRLEKLGLEDVYSDFASGEVRYAATPAHDLEKVTKAIESIGFEVVDTRDLEQTGYSTIEKKFFFATLFSLPLVLAMFMPESWAIHNPWVQFALCLPVFGLGSWHFGKSAIGGLKSGIANMDVLILIGSTAAFGYSLAGSIMFAENAHDYLFFETTATIITLVLLGNVLEHRSVKQTTTAIRELTQLQKTEAKHVKDGGQVQTIAASDIRKGYLLLLNQGDQVPCDGIIERGEATLDESMLTGESEPVHRKIEAELIGGTIVQEGTVYLRATRVGNQTTLSKIIGLVKDAQADQPPIQKLGDKISAIFVPAVLGIATVTFLISWLWIELPLATALMNSIAVLVISCPCAMGLATPTAVIAGIGRGARKGILIKGGSTLEQFAKVQTVVFDKTGTLTTGRFRIDETTITGDINESQVRRLLFHLEQHSSHPIAQSMVRELSDFQGEPMEFENVTEHKGKGVEALDSEGVLWKAGAAAWLMPEADADIVLTRNGDTVAELRIADELKPGAREMIQALQQKGIQTVLLSGDRAAKCKVIAEETGITTVHSGQSPEGKLKVIEALKVNGLTAMVGDGINDAPALAASDLGISLGDASQVAIQSAQVVLLKSDNLLRLRDAFLVGRHTYLTIKQNLFWAFFYNIVAIPLAAMGFLNPMLAALAMAFSDVIVIGNSIRLKFKTLR